MIEMGQSIYFFELTFGNEKFEAPIRDGLLDMYNGSPLHQRLAVGRVLEMIEIGDLVDEVRTSPEKIDQIKTSLEDFSKSNEEHLVYAAKVV